MVSRAHGYWPNYAVGLFNCIKGWTCHTVPSSHTMTRTSKVKSQNAVTSAGLFNRTSPASYCEFLRHAVFICCPTVQAAAPRAYYFFSLSFELLSRGSSMHGGNLSGRTQTRPRRIGSRSRRGDASSVGQSDAKSPAAATSPRAAYTWAVGRPL